MTCDEFATAGLDLGAAGEDDPLQKAAREHLRECSHCAALHENWLALRQDLRTLGAETVGAQAPSRVEMRLRQEFLTKHKTRKLQRAAVIAGWTFAAAASLALAITGTNWYLQRNAKITNVHANAEQPLKVNSQVATPGSNLGEVLVASNGAGEFTLLPDSMPLASEDTTVVRVRMQRAALGELGLTVNEEHASDWIQVDLLVGDDGQPQAVRLPQATESTN